MHLKYKFGFDMDGVLYDWFEALKPTFNIFGYHFEDKEDLYDFFNRKNDLFKNNIISMPFTYSTLNPHKSIIDTVNFLGRKYEIFYITYRPKESYLGTIRWLKENKFPCYENLIMSNNKAIDIRINKIDFFVEDREDIIKEIIGITNVIQKINFYTKNIVEGIYKSIYNITDLMDM